ncbi:MAG TPA: exosortase K [Myxococcota bacterium]|nr:exosortase K [Myxococcota bacterium]
MREHRYAESPARAEATVRLRSAPKTPTREGNPHGSSLRASLADRELTLRLTGAPRSATGGRLAAAADDAFCTLRENAATLAVAFSASFALKAHYARASADELGFVLGPTAALVELLTGVAFEREPGAGFVSREHHYLIAPACAGLNYSIAAFAMLVLGFAGRIRRPARRAAWLLAAAALACAATLIVNAVRIALALELREAGSLSALGGASAHRLLGVAVYLGSLWALWACVERGFAERSPAWLAALLPLALYLGVTLLAPLLNGGHARAEFWAHAQAVLAASFALGALAYAALSARRSR